MPLNRSEVVHLLTLWFVVLIFLQTLSGETGALVTGAGFVAIGLAWGVPLYLVVETAPVLRAR